MLDVDRQIKATLLRAIPILVAVGMAGVFYHYWPTSGVVTNPEARREIERMAEEGPVGELKKRESEPEPPFSGSLTAEQKVALHRVLVDAGKYSVDIIPVSESYEGSSISPAVSKASADEFAALFWRAGWDARVFESNPHPSSRPLGAIALVVNPNSKAENPRRGRKGAQLLLKALEEQGIHPEFYTSNKVDPESFELHLTIRTLP